MSKKKQKSMEELLEEALVPEEEQPYKVPENWVWTRLGKLLELVYGKSLPEKKRSGNGFPVYGSNGVVGYHSEFLIEGPVIIVGRKGSYGEVNWYNESGWAIDTTYYVLAKQKINYKYVYYLLKTLNLKKLNRSTAIPGLNREDAYTQKVVLPPFKEQKRIVEKIEQLFAKIDEAKRLIEEVKESFELRRAAILDKAIKGKLVSQSPLDEPADKLLQYIEEQKQHLVKQKKIKKEKPLPILEQNELLYNIPENWRWVRLGEVIELISGRDVSAKECNNEGVGVPYIMGASNIADDRLIIERWIEKPSVVGKKGDVLLSVKGTVGKTIIQEVEEAHLSRQIMGLRPIHGVHNGYLKIFIQTYVQVLKEKSKGVIPGISREDVLLAPLPLPPYNEQKRIAEKVELLLSKLETEKEMVLEVEQKLDLLKQSILNKAFRGELGTNDPTDEHAIKLLKEVLKSK
jgi:type I restriction enzyme, S subunit